MRLAFVCRPLVFHGGVETSTAGLLGELLRRGHVIDLLTTRGQADVPGLNVRRLLTLPEPSALRLLVFAMSARRAAAAGRYDIVQSHERGLRQDIYRAGEGVHRAYLAAMGRGSVPWSPHHRLVCALEERIFSLRSTRHVVAISRGGKAEIERFFGPPSERVSCIYNGVDLGRFHPDNRARHGASIRAALGLPADSWVVLFVGSGFRRKGLEPLLRGIAQLADARIRLVVAGKGDAEAYRTLAERLGLATRVVWMGVRRDVERLYAGADVVALPALYEPFGNVHLEALATGVPMLSSRAAGGAELIVDGRNGWVVASSTAEAIASGLIELREGDARRLALAARESAEPFTLGAQADGFEALYRELKQ